MVLLAGLALGAWAGGSCGARTPVPAPAVACAPAEGTLPAGARADALAGEYRLTLAATRGARAGQSTAASLRLLPLRGQPPVAPAAGASYPLYGGTDAALAEVGAVAHGSPAPADPAGPGVLVMAWPRPNAPAGTNEVMLRLGADANRGNARPFDGAFTALTVTEIAAGRFAGTWESGGGDVQAGGYFCADRVPSRG